MNLTETLSKQDYQDISDLIFRIMSEAYTRSIFKPGAPPSLVLVGKFIILDNGERKPTITAWNDFPVKSEADKYALGRTLEHLILEPEYEFVISAFEAWVLMDPDKESQENIGQGKSLENHPRRTESVIFNILSKDFQLVVLNPILRDPETSNVILEKGKLDFNQNLTGRLVRNRPPLN